MAPSLLIWSLAEHPALGRWPLHVPLKGSQGCPARRGCGSRLWGTGTGGGLCLLLVKASESWYSMCSSPGRECSWQGQEGFWHIPVTGAGPDPTVQCSPSGLGTAPTRQISRISTYPSMSTPACPPALGWGKQSVGENPKGKGRRQATQPTLMAASTDGTGDFINRAE